MLEGERTALNTTMTAGNMTTVRSMRQRLAGYTPHGEENGSVLAERMARTEGEDSLFGQIDDGVRA